MPSVDIDTIPSLLGPAPSLQMLSLHMLLLLLPEEPPHGDTSAVVCCWL
jgi:hypothetical protein